MNLNERQRALLHTIVNGRVQIVDSDGRTRRALVERGLAVERGRWIEATSAGIAMDQGPLPPPRKRRGRSGAQEARAEAIRRASDQLERVLPAGAEVLVGSIMAAAADVIAGFRTYASRAEKNRNGDGTTR